MSPEVRRRRSRSRRRWRHLVRRAQDRPRLAVGVAAGAVLLVCVLWCVWRAWSVAHDLDEASNKAQIMRAALARGDVAGARRALGEFQDAAGGADDKTDGPTWWFFEHVPFLGDDASGIATVSSVIDDLGTQGLEPVMGAAGQVTGKRFEPHRHRFPLAEIAAMQGPAKRSEHAFATAQSRLDAVDSSGFIGPFRHRFDSLRSLVGAGRSTLGSAYRAAKMMPDLLGAHRPRNYLLVMENNAELRSLGGLSGSVSLVHADHGRVRMTDQDDMADLAGQPDVRLTGEERNLFGNLLSATGVNATMTPDAPRAADLVRRRWIADHGGTVDGVFFVDPVAVSYLLQGLGTVRMPLYPPLTWTNVVPSVENQIYVETADRHAQSDYQNAVAKAVFNTFADGHGNPVTAIRGLARGVAEGRIRMTSFVPVDQRQITGTAIAGELPTTPTAHPQAGVYLNDSTESKMSFYLHDTVNVASRSCGDGFQTASGTMTLDSQTPPDVLKLPIAVTGLADPSRGIRRGQQFVVAYLASPIGGEVTGLNIDGREIHDPALVRFKGRQIATVGVHLSPGSTHIVQWVMRSGIRQTGSWQVSVTPDAQPGTESTSSASAC